MIVASLLALVLSFVFDFFTFTADCKIQAIAESAQQQKSPWVEPAPAAKAATEESGPAASQEAVGSGISNTYS